MQDFELLNATEQAIVDALSKEGRMLASTIARKTRVKRPTVYAALAKLQDAGIIITFLDKHSRYFQLVDAEALQDVLNLEAKATYQAKLHAIESLAEHIKARQAEQHQFLSGFELSTVDLTETVYQELATAFKSNKRLRAIFNPQLVIVDEASRKHIKDFLRIAHENGAQIQEIAVAGPVTDWYAKQIHNPKHELKQIDASQKLLTDCIFGEEAIYFLKYDNSEGAGVRIQRPDLIQSMNVIFDLLWDRL